MVWCWFGTSSEGRCGSQLVLRCTPHRLRTPHRCATLQVSVSLLPSLPTASPLSHTPVGCAHHNDVAPALHAVHQRQQLGHDAPLNLALRQGGTRRHTGGRFQRSCRGEWQLLTKHC